MVVETSRGFPDERARAWVEDRLRVAVHELRQPLATVLALTAAARSQPGAGPEVTGYLDAIAAQVQEVSSAAWSVLCASDGDDEAPVDVDEVLDSVLASFAVTWRGTLTQRGDSGAVVSGSRAAIRRCLVNVVDNATRAAGPDGSVVLTTRRRTDVVQVLVEDDGPGLGRIPTGSGVGLRETRRVLRELGGDLSFTRPAAGRGARVLVSLPPRKPWGHRSVTASAG